MKISAANIVRLHEAKHYIDTNFKQHITIDILAIRHGLTSQRFKPMFRQMFGVKPFDYLRDVRMKEAKRLLKETDYKIEVVASEVGYGTKQSLSNVFNRLLKMTPGEYRKGTFEDVKSPVCPYCGK